MRRVRPSASSALEGQTLSRAFTLVEILVVVAIIAVLVGIVGGNFIGSRIRARDSERKNSLSQVAKALELYISDYNFYPESVGGEVAGINWGETWMDAENTTYMKQLPSDSREPTIQYYYETNTDLTKFRLFTRLENPQDIDTDLDGDGQPGDEYDGSVGDGTAKSCGTLLCNFGISSPNTTMSETFN